MRKLLLLLFIVGCSLARTSLGQMPAPATPPPTLRSLLLAQLRSTHNKAEWFTPTNTAIAGLTPEQARWVPTNAAGKLDPGNNHSVAQLTAHLVFWNENALEQLRGHKPPPFNGKNEETFRNVDAAQWADLAARFDKDMTEMETFVEHASEPDLLKAAGMLAHIGTHNAYHTGQILYVRKLQGSWNPKNGV